MNLHHRLILASNSPRRQQLLREAGFEFQVYTDQVNEDFSSDIPAEEVAIHLACRKNDHYRQVLSDSIVLTADTTVLLGNALLNKPSTAAEAVAMLSSLSGKTHQVITGVCISYGREVQAFSDRTAVTFKWLTKEEIDFYVDTYRPLDKAGAYGIQEWIGMIGIQKIEGSYFNVMGLPVHKVYESLSRYKM